MNNDEIDNNWSQLARLARSDLGSDAFALVIILRSRHRDGATFAVSPGGMETWRVIPGWNKRRYRKARDELEKAGLIVCTDEGGSGRGEASQFEWGEAFPR